MKKTKRPILWITALLVVVIIVTTISIVADDGFVSPFKNKAEEQAALKASEEFDARQEIEIKKQKEYEASLTSEDRQRIEEEKKAAEEEIYQEKKKAAVIRYADLQKQLEEFDATHDLNNLSEEDNIKRIAIADEMLDLYGQYIEERTPPTPAERLEDLINALVTEREIILYGLRIDLDKAIERGDQDKIAGYKSEMARTNYKTFHVKEIEKRYLAGEDPEVLIGEIPKWQKTYYDYRSPEEEEAFVEEWWNKPIE